MRSPATVKATPATRRSAPEPKAARPPAGCAPVRSPRRRSGHRPESRTIRAWRPRRAETPSVSVRAAPRVVEDAQVVPDAPGGGCAVSASARTQVPIATRTHQPADLGRRRHAQDVVPLDCGNQLRRNRARGVGLCRLGSMSASNGRMWRGSVIAPCGSNPLDASISPLPRAARARSSSGSCPKRYADLVGEGHRARDLVARQVLAAVDEDVLLGQ